MDKKVVISGKNGIKCIQMNILFKGLRFLLKIKFSMYISFSKATFFLVLFMEFGVFFHEVIFLLLMFVQQNTRWGTKNYRELNLTCKVGNYSSEQIIF